MKKLFLTSALLFMLNHVEGGAPFHISQVVITTVNCSNAAQGANTLDFFVQGGTGPYSLTAQNGTPSEQNSSNGLFNPLTQTNTGPVIVTLSDSAGAVIEDQTFPLLPTAFSNITVTTNCPNELGYSITIYDLEGPGVLGATVSLSGPGGTRTSTELTDTFSNLTPGNYMLSIVPITGQTPGVCVVSLTIPVTIVKLPFSAIAKNTAVSQGSTLGELQVATLEGTPNFTFTLTGPLPSTRDDYTPTITGSTAIFSGLEGGFYTAEVLDSDECTVSTRAAVNFFKNHVANRIKLSYC